MNRNLQTTLHGHGPFFYTKTKGTKPGVESYQRGLLLAHRVFVCVEHRQNRYYTTFPSKEAFWDYYTKVPANRRHFYWINVSSQIERETCHLHFDVEWSTRENRQTIDKRITTIRTLVEKAFPTHDTRMLKVDLCRDIAGTPKHSFHLHFPGIVFPSNTSMKPFVDKLVTDNIHVPELFWQKRQESACIIDTSIYTKNRCLRVPGSTKANENQPPQQLPSKDVFMVTRMCDTRAKVNVTVPPMPVTFSHNLSRPRPAVQATRESIRMQNGIKKMLEAVGDTSTVVTYTGDGIFYGEADYRRCLIAPDRTHHHNNCYFVIKDDRYVYYHCFSSNGHPFCAGKFLGDLQAPQAIRYSSSGEFIGDAVIASKWNDENGVLITEHDDEYVKPYVLEYGRDVLLINAGMGKGKSSRAKELVESLDPGKRVLIVLSRRSLTWAFYHSFTGFKHYSEGTNGHDRLIIEYESLHRLQGQGKFDYVIADEIRSLCATMIAPTNGANTRTNAVIFRELATECEQFICMDADSEVDPCVSILLQAWFPRPHSIQVERYTESKIIHSLYPRTNERTWTSLITEKLQNGNSVAICCRTKKRLKILEEALSPYATSTITLSSETSDEQVKHALSDINMLLTGVQLFLYTTKVNVGVDITLPWDYCFADCLSAGCGPRDMMQMIGRMRNLRCHDIHVLMDSITPAYVPLDELIDEQTRLAVHRRDLLANDYARLLSFDAAYVDGYLTLAPDWFSRLLCAASVKEHFVYGLFRLARLKQWKVYPIVEEKEDHGDVLQAVETTNEHSAAEFERIYEQLRDDDPARVVAEVAILVKQQNSTHEDRTKGEFAHTLLKFPEFPTIEEFKYAHAHMNILRNHYKRSQLSSAQLTRMELNRLHKHVWSDVTLGSDVMQYSYIDQALQLAGFTAYDDYGNRRSAANLDTHAERIIQLCNDSASSGNRNYRPKRGATLKPITCIRRELRHVYGISLHKKRGSIWLEVHPEIPHLLEKMEWGYDFGTSVPTLVDNIEEKHQQKKRKRLL